jgi:hypothetical protein
MKIDEAPACQVERHDFAGALFCDVHAAESGDYVVCPQGQRSERFERPGPRC